MPQPNMTLTSTRKSKVKDVEKPARMVVLSPESFHWKKHTNTPVTKHWGWGERQKTNNNLNEKYVGKCAGGEAVKVHCV